MIIGIMVSLFVVQNWLISGLSNLILFPAPPPSYKQSLAGLNVLLDEVSGRKNAILFIPQHLKPNRPFVLYFHGNASDVGISHGLLSAFASGTNANVVAVEYPGYGVLSDSAVTADGINAAAEFALDYLVKLEVPPHRIFLYGWSIGTGVAARLAKHAVDKGLQLGGLILQAPYFSIRSLVSDFTPVGVFLVQNYWDTAEVLSKLQLPLLIIHGGKDKLIGPNHGKRLYEISSSKKKRLLISPEMTHNYWDIYEDMIFPTTDFISDNLND